MSETFETEVRSVRDLGLRDAMDSQIFQAARAAGAIVMSKDSDFVELVERLGIPPQVLWITCGNTTNSRLKQILGKCFSQALMLLQNGEPIVEINDAFSAA